MSVHWNDLVEGWALEPRTVGPFTRTDFVRYQGASGDFQPIHHDEPFAQASGYDTVLGIGMLPAGLLSALATDCFGPHNVRGTRIRWRSPVWPGDELHLQGTVVKRYEQDDERRVDLALSGLRGDEVVVQVWMTFVLN